MSTGEATTTGPSATLAKVGPAVQPPPGVSFRGVGSAQVSASVSVWVSPRSAQRHLVVGQHRPRRALLGGEVGPVRERLLEPLLERRRRLLDRAGTGPGGKVPDRREQALRAKHPDQ